MVRLHLLDWHTVHHETMDRQPFGPRVAADDLRCWCVLLREDHLNQQASAVLGQDTAPGMGWMAWLTFSWLRGA